MGWRRGWIKGLMKVFFDGSIILKEWGMMGLQNEYEGMCDKIFSRSIALEVD